MKALYRHNLLRRLLLSKGPIGGAEGPIGETEGPVEKGKEPTGEAKGPTGGAEGAEETFLINIINFLKGLTMKNCIYMMAKAWDAIKQSTLRKG